MREVQVARWKNRHPVMEGEWIEYDDVCLDQVQPGNRLELALEWDDLQGLRAGRNLYAYFSSRGGERRYTGHLLLASYPLSVGIAFDPRKGYRQGMAVWGTSQTTHRLVQGAHMSYGRRDTDYEVWVYRIGWDAPRSLSILPFADPPSVDQYVKNTPLKGGACS
ncbi:MAG TPA: hypothetical protein VJC16_07310 [Candidatus Nanoarchaeia archaeon]|nr:hypothetical protein [Candidatus Nanoarchaeia archaeon]